MTQKAYYEALEARGRQILEAVAPSASSFWGAHALMALDVDRERVAQIIQKQFEMPTMGTFDALAALMFLCRYEHDLSEEMRAQIKEGMTQSIFHRGNTENHWLMYYTSMLLATEQWPDVEVWWNGLSRTAMHEEATRWILGMIDRTARQGHYEYDSPQYHTCHVLAMVALADHTQDPHMRTQAEQMATLYVADMALEYLRGVWTGGHSREGYQENTWTFVGAGTTLGLYYFGDVEFDPTVTRLEMACPVVTARFRPPALLAELACDRTRPMVVKKTKPPRALYRHGTRPAEPVRKTTYITPSFALGSTQAGFQGTEGGPIDLVSWDLSWPGPKHQSVIVSNHPYLSPRRFSAFLSELPQVIGRSVPAVKPYLQNPDGLFGGSPYEQMLQHESAIIVLYRIPSDDEASWVNLYIPKGLRARVEQDGWIIADAETLYVAIRPIGNYRWLEAREGSSVDGWLVRIDGPDAGVALEAVEAAQVTSFDAFCSQVASARVDLTAWPEPGRVCFTTPRGHVLDITYDGPHRIDGIEVDYSMWPLFEAPGVEAPIGTGRMVFEREDRLGLDFKVDASRPLLPMRVIG